MAKRAFVLTLFLVVIVSLGIFTIKGFGREADSSNKDKELRFISEKIDEVLKNQQSIVERLKDIREQQDTIRIRASR